MQIPMISFVRRKNIKRKGKPKGIDANIQNKLCIQPSSPLRSLRLQCTYQEGRACSLTHITYNNIEQAWDATPREGA